MYLVASVLGPLQHIRPVTAVTSQLWGKIREKEERTKNFLKERIMIEVLSKKLRNSLKSK